MSMTYQHTRFRYANQAVGVFVILTVILFLGAFFFSGQIREWFDPGERIRDGLYGLSEGAEVDIMGTKAGRVLQLAYSRGICRKLPLNSRNCWYPFRP